LGSWTALGFGGGLALATGKLVHPSSWGNISVSKVSLPASGLAAEKLKEHSAYLAQRYTAQHIGPVPKPDEEQEGEEGAQEWGAFFEGEQ